MSSKFEKGKGTQILEFLYLKYIRKHLINNTNYSAKTIYTIVLS